MGQFGDVGPSKAHIINFFADQCNASIAAKVAAALVKSKLSDRELFKTIKSLIRENLNPLSLGKR